jgi:hypothetical protein
MSTKEDTLKAPDITENDQTKKEACFWKCFTQQYTRALLEAHAHIDAVYPQKKQLKQRQKKRRARAADCTR